MQNLSENEETMQLQLQFARVLLSLHLVIGATTTETAPQDRHFGLAQDVISHL